MRDALRQLLGGLMLAGLVAVPDITRAVSIEFAVVSLGGDMYRYEYTVTNDGALGPRVAIELFEILFEPLLYDEGSLTIVTADPPAADWSEGILFSLPGVPAAYDALALSGGIPPS